MKTSACGTRGATLSVVDGHLYVMQQLYVIANNYLIPSQLAGAISTSRYSRRRVTLAVCVALGFALSPRKSRCDTAIESQRRARRRSSPTWRARDPRELIVLVEMYACAERKESSQYFKVKLLDPDGVGGQVDRSSFYHGDRQVAPRRRDRRKTS